MEQQEDLKIEQAEELPAQGSGSLLAAERKKQNKTVEDISAELNLSVTQINTIELDQTDGLPEPTYVRGYIRAYAKLLGLNPEDVLKNYLNQGWKNSSSLNDIPRRIGNAEESKSSFFSAKKTISLLLLLMLFAFLWYSGILTDLLGSELTGQTTSPVAVTTLSKPANEESQQVISNDDVTQTAQQNAAEGSNTADGSGSNVAEGSNTAEGSGSNVAEGSNTAEGSNSNAVQGSDTASETIAASGAAANRLLMTFSETSWVDIRDNKDTRLAYKTYAVGEQLEVSSALPMKVFLGNAAGVTVLYNGQTFDISDFREGVYAKFTVGDQ